LANFLRQALSSPLIITPHSFRMAVLRPLLLLVFQMPWSASWADGIVIVISDTFKSPMTL